MALRRAIGVGGETGVAALGGDRQHLRDLGPAADFSAVPKAGAGGIEVCVDGVEAFDFEGVGGKLVDLKTVSVASSQPEVSRISSPSV